jgi:hypothetical protein
MKIPPLIPENFFFQGLGAGKIGSVLEAFLEKQAQNAT